MHSFGKGQLDPSLVSGHTVAANRDNLVVDMLSRSHHGAIRYYDRRQRYAIYIYIYTHICNKWIKPQHWHSLWVAEVCTLARVWNIDCGSRVEPSSVKYQFLMVLWHLDLKVHTSRVNPMAGLGFWEIPVVWRLTRENKQKWKCMQHHKVLRLWVHLKDGVCYRTPRCAMTRTWF
jgi:hypothetical protein